MTVTTTIPIPTIALAADTGTGAGAGADSDGITNNGLVNVTGLVAGATWKHTIKGTTIDALASSVTTFTLPEGVYEVSEVQVVQTLNGADSAPAMFAMQITVDTAAPAIALLGDASVSHAHGTNYADAGVSGVDAAAGETLATVITDSGDTAVDAVDTTTAAGVYTYTYTATDRAGNVSASVTRTVTVAAAPMLTAERQTDNSIRLAWSNIPTDYRYQIFLKEGGTTSDSIFELAPNDNNFVIIHTTMAFFERLNAAQEIGMASITRGSAIGSITFASVPELNPTGTVEPTITATRLADNSIQIEWRNLPTHNSYDGSTIKDGVSTYLQIIPRTSPYVWATDNSKFETVTNADRIAISGRADLAIFPVGGHTVQISAPVPALIQALAFEVNPELASNNALDSNYAKEGDELKLTFTVNQALASDPTVTIAGRDAAVTKTDNAYTASLAVLATDTEGAVEYDIGTLTAADAAVATFDPPAVASAIHIDRTAPTVTLGPIAAGLVADEQDHDITFSEDVTDLKVGDFTSSDDVRVTNVSGSGSAYTLTLTPNDESFSLALAANAVTDLAGNTGPANTVRVNGTANYAPTARAGDPQTKVAGMEVTLDGSDSNDNGNPVTYSWAHTLTDGNLPAPEAVITLTGPDTAAPTFTAPAAAGAYTFTLTVMDTFAPPASATDTVVITVTTVTNTAPVISGNAAVDYAETELPLPFDRTDVVATYTAMDAEGDDFLFVIDGAGFITGADARFFSLSTRTGRLTADERLNFELPTDANSDGVYELTITAVTGGGNSEPFDVRVTVTNVDEAGAATIDGTVQVGQTLTAGATDPDAVTSGNPNGDVTGSNYRWVSTPTGLGSSSTEIANGPSAIYMLKPADSGKTIRVGVTYMDGQLTKNVLSADTGVVAAATLSADSTLSALEVSAGSLNPTFESGIYAYAVSVGTGVESITVTPTATDTTGAAVTVDGDTVASGEASAAIDLTVGNNPILIIVTAEDASTQTYTVTVARGVVPPPGIALHRDTAFDDGVNNGVNTDRITRNRDIDVTLASDFDTTRDMWEFSSNSGTGYDTGTGTSFTLPEGSAEYSTDQVRVHQTVDGVTSEPAGLDAFTIDIDAPTVNLGSIADAVLDRAGQMHGITFSEEVTGLTKTNFRTSTGIEVTAVSGSGTDYTITYTPTMRTFTLRFKEDSLSDIAGNFVAATDAAGTAANTAPVIDTTDAAVEHAENTPVTMPVATYATDDTNTIAWSISGGTDASFFDIDATNGDLTFKASPDFETPGSAAMSNTYSVTITATETDGVPSDLASAPLTVTVTVINAEDAGSVSAISGTAQVSATLTAGTVVTDEDSPDTIAIIGHQWQSAPDGTAADSAAWSPISGATSATYEVVVADEGNTLRVVVSYTDDFGGNTDQAASASTAAVVAAGAVPTPSIALAADTGADTSDGITGNDVVNVSGLATGATWTYTIKDGTATTVTDTSVITFTLPEGVYAVGEVQVVQTLNSADSAPAMFAMQITVDQTKPIITLDGGPVTVAHGGTYTAVEDAGISGAGSDDTTATTTTRPGPDATVVPGIAVDTDTAGDYTITYTATDLAGNVSDPVTRTVTVFRALFTVATLSALDVSEDALDPTFASGTDAYAVSLGTDVESITVTPTVTDTDHATVTVNGVAVTSGQPSVAIDLNVGNTPISIIVTAEDTSVTQTYTVTVARAVPAPGIALERDTAADGGVNTDRLTRNRGIAVTLASDFDTNAANIWQWSINGGGDYTTITDHSVQRFGLPEGSAEYSTDQVRVRQTVNSVTSEPAGLDAFTIDLDAPTANLGTIAGAVIDQGGQTHAITFSENVFGLAADDFSASTGIEVTAVSGSDGGTDYTITYTATLASFNLILARKSVTDIAANPVALTSMTGTATAANTAPTINTGNETPSHAENTPIATAVATYTTDDTNAIAWSHVGTDASLFLIDPTSGVLTFRASPDYETPASAATSNTYSVTITATETNGDPSDLASAPLAVTVTVTNVDEEGSISAITGTVQVGQTLAAGDTVTDEDGAATGITYQWQRGDAAGENNNDIGGATGNTYEVMVADEDNTLRVVVSYMDGFGGNTDQATSASTAAVLPPARSRRRASLWLRTPVLIPAMASPAMAWSM